MSRSMRVNGTTTSSQSDSVDGIFNVDKPPDITSMDVVRRVKRASGHKRVGHGGTLDPIATGVIPICLGQATRMMEYLIDGTREYRGMVELGIETDTYDALGSVVREIDASHVALKQVENALLSFKGNIQQVPPMYSALKRQGRRLYELARAGIHVERNPRDVYVVSIEILNWVPPIIDLRVTCGRGFYMRSLAHDLGQALGCGGYMKTLVRLRSGTFEISESLSLEKLEQMLATDSWQDSIFPPDHVVSNLKSVIVGRSLEEMIIQNRFLPPGLSLPIADPDEHCRVYSTDGRFIAIMYFNACKGLWQRTRMFSLNYSS